MLRYRWYMGPEEPLISVIVPTIAGRKHWLERCHHAYRQTTEQFELLVLHDFETCGKAWNAGIPEARGQFIQLSADDLEPHPGWAQAAIGAVQRGVLPCPRILNSDGSLQSCGNLATEAEEGTPSDVARIPFFPRALVGVLHPVFDNHYMGDYWITQRARQAGWQTVVVRDYLFTHHMASEGRLDTLEQDVAAYEKATR